GGWFCSRRWGERITPMIDLTEVGAFSSIDATGQLAARFGLYLPGITAVKGYQVLVRIIHRDDRFDPDILPRDFPLTWQSGTPLDLWTTNVPLAAVPGTNFGNPGAYLYRFQLLKSTVGGGSRVVTVWFTDPFARATDIGRLPSFTTPGSQPT